MLEHGAVWVTYNPKTLPAAQLTELKAYVSGQDRMALTPYAGSQDADLAAVVGLSAVRHQGG